jgi:hypothetical protein
MMAGFGVNAQPLDSASIVGDRQQAGANGGAGSRHTDTAVAAVGALSFVTAVGQRSKTNC